MSHYPDAERDVAWLLDRLADGITGSLNWRQDSGATIGSFHFPESQCRLEPKTLFNIGNSANVLLSSKAADRIGVSPDRYRAVVVRATKDLLKRRFSRSLLSKWGGFRMLASVRDGAVRLISRNGHSFTALFGPITEALRGFPVAIVLDGEVVCINDKGRPDFEALQARLRPRNGKLPGRLCYMVFDCLHLNGHSMLARPLEERQAVLREVPSALQSDAVNLTESSRRPRASGS